MRGEAQIQTPGLPVHNFYFHLTSTLITTDILWKNTAFSPHTPKHLKNFLNSILKNAHYTDILFSPENRSVLPWLHSLQKKNIKVDSKKLFPKLL